MSLNNSSQFRDFAQQANYFGQNKLPFFFLIDFEQQKPIILPIEQAAKENIFFTILQPQGIKSNVDWHFEFSAKDCHFSFNPMKFKDYQQGFELVKSELQKGNSYLLNLTYPSKIETNYSLIQLFQQTKASYKLLFKNEFICFSPEPFIQIYENKIYTYPMKGTINATLENAEQQLLNSQKELREHYTIVDLMRNDLAIVAKNIEVKRFRYVEKIHTERGAILQTSSEICGELEENWRHNIGHILAALLPAGSISGAPKEKTVEIIQQAEQQKRGYYTGVFGIFDGETLQSAVAIRFIEKRSDGYYFRSGGGITIQSDIEDEYNELCAKVYLPLIK
ncbi:aminodeoxychorismate synthase component I [Histophilus somni]|uniref:Aminodeoxychorismate synthase component I n=1 Tax=Histophilus somni TaxID=731 RepID=A0A9Q6Z130_HISSO|nr:aminodeoxychorismate synthase component I [Histophilus somni]ARU64139.1 aminodeoxychorismate synthase component I [Histophilus somni]ARU65920.1 aminodeoxychorismate synthase component I [Histophilus somni]ARU67794.1 aminodeoxychorismate synthase component I [Histophilus somni]ARU69674.1 aminodeoxychorismate synthase component I [Histophilus somni]ARU71551.1 aminodeoxychorismate synthase component I [Histophilus somni]